MQNRCPQGPEMVIPVLEGLFLICQYPKVWGRLFAARRTSLFWSSASFYKEHGFGFWYEHTIPMVAEIMRYDKVVQNMAISVPLGIATVGSWQGQRQYFKQVCSLTFDTGKYERGGMVGEENATYLQISRDVRSCQNASRRRKENRKHAKEAALLPPPIGNKIFGKNVRCWEYIWSLT